MSVREERDVSVQASKSFNQAIRTGGYIRGGFAAGAAVQEQVPPRVLFANVGRAPAFVIAIIPFRQIRFDLGNRFPPEQLARAACAQARTGENMAERNVAEQEPEFSRCLFAILRQRQIGSP